jgi:hypothetical protein
MPLKTKDDHVHELGRIKIDYRGKPEFRWKCLNPDCLAMFKKHQITGKRSTCCICHENTLILDNEALKRAKPRCSACSGTRENVIKNKTVEVARDFLDDLFEEGGVAPAVDVIENFDSLSEDDQQYAKDILNLFSKED